MSNHTRGPWQYSDRNWRGEWDESGNLYVTGDHRPADEDEGDPGECCTGLAIVTGNPTSFGVTRANARLIAAAPELLRVLKLAQDAVDNEHYERMHAEYGEEPGPDEPVCTCFDEVDGAPDGPPPGTCLPCQIRRIIAKAEVGRE